MTRSLLRLSGADVLPFLQNLVTTDLARLSDGAIYTALLTPQGKYLADFFLVADGQDVLLDVDADLAASLGQRLSLYKLRADVAIAAEDRVYLHRGLGDTPADGWADPRHAAFGWRAWRAETPTTDETDWDALRVAHMVPETGRELTPDSYILEMNFEALGGVDFRKGCFVGQEVTARMKHKTALRKGLARVRIEGSAAQGDEILAEGKPAGTLLTRAGDQALAYLRFDRAKGAMSCGEAKVTRIG